MKLKRTIFTIVLLGISIVFLYFWQRTEEKKQEEIKSAKKIFAFNKEEIGEIGIKSDKGEIVLFKKEDGSWELIKPVRAKADYKVVSGIIEKLGEINLTGLFEVSPSQLSSYGLFPPKAEVNLSEGNKKNSFYLGEETPSANSVYIKRDKENRVLIVDRVIIPLLLKDVFEFRDKRVINFDRREINKIELIYPDKSKSFDLSKYSNEWQLQRPMKTKADQEEVNKIFDLLLGLRVKKFEEDEFQDNKRYSFHSPQLKILLDFNKGESETLFFGGGSEEGVYARLGSKKEIYVVSGDILEKLPKKVFDLRNKKLAPFNSNEIESIKLISKEKTIELEKGADDRWNIIEPVKTKGDTIEIGNLIYEIVNLRFKEFIDNVSLPPSTIGIDSPEREIILKGKHKTHLVRIKIGKIDNNKYSSYAINDLDNQLGMIDYTFVRDYLDLDLGKLKGKDIANRVPSPSRE